MTTQYTADTLREYLTEMYAEDAPQVISQVNGWLRRGDGVAIYVNQDLGHPDLGQPRLASYGSLAALLETDEPPVRLPDTPTMINWRYQLEGTYRGEPL